jgi:LysM repeat protein
MNNPNPFVPKGSILEQQSKRRSRLKLAVFCVLAVSIAGLSVMLIEGCKREAPVETTETATPTIDTNTPTIADTNTPTIDTNVVPYLPPSTTNTSTVAPPAAAPAGTEYTVAKGDFLETIAKKNGVTVKALEAANPGVIPKKLKIGQKLTIPAGSSATPNVAAADSTGSSAASTIYVVKSGDNLTKIAKHFGTSVKAIESENNLTTAGIKVGQKLKIPAKAGAVSASAPAPEPAPATSAPVVMPESVPGK